ncbi:Serine/threonine-protein kinase par-1 [Physocladia obscura]|uniref:non-specific serine/threonine protein kinase n=1 Tax=Physocladia obscura TaxID=109957 RepID=A0AAD5T7K6_9FUNG|nr:Serine/threonine-protein kinase par-1 [Physocladia obscura]
MTTPKSEKEITPLSSKRRDKDDTLNPDFQLPGIGNYIFQKTVGEGNFAKVKLSKHKLTGVEVAIKVIDKTTLDEKKLGKLYREVRIMKMLNHPHIVKLYEVIETKYTVFLVMEYASGGELYDYLVVHGKMKEKDARVKFRQILSAVSYCHKKRVIHRDLKAENLLLDSNLDIKIADFGFSNYFDPDGKLETFCGSPPYAAPELFQGRRYVGPEVDIWSLGVILYVLTTGCLPFDGKNLQEMRESVCRGKYRIPFYLSDQCEKLLRKFLVRDPYKRNSLDLLIDDSWINEGYNNDSPIASDLSATVDEDESVIKLLETKHNIDRETVLKSLRENKYDDTAAIYYLLYFEKFSRSRRNTEQPAMPGINTANVPTVSPPLASPNEPTAHSAMAAIPSLSKQFGETAATITAAKANAAASAHANKIDEDFVSDNVTPLPQSNLRPKLTAAKSNEAAKRRITVGSESDAHKRFDDAQIPAAASGIPSVVEESSIGVAGVPTANLAVGHHVAPAISRLNNTRDSNDNTTNPSLHVSAPASRIRANSAIPTGSAAAAAAAVSSGGGQLSSVDEGSANASGSGGRKRGESIVGMIRNVGITMRRRSELVPNPSEKSVLVPPPQHHQHGEKDTGPAGNNQTDSMTATELTASQAGIPRGEDANRPRSLRFTFNSNTTSSKNPDDIVAEIIVACVKYEVSHTVITRYLLEGVWSKGAGGEPVKFEMEVCKLPRLKSLFGLRFKRLSGASSDYKNICEKILASLVL